ncbi:hypothetical protein F4677DRAFT_448871 [Hypoxylon crocopeplum]|nr:hypothetical protein F4677DRAFT_448871 [Hypoxylon crocopeplum]
MDFDKLSTSAIELFHQNKPLITTAAGILSISATIPLLSRVRADYNAWYALGPNALPLNPFGYAFQAIAGLFARLDTRVPAPYDATALSQTPRYGPLSQRSFLPTSIPQRSGARPDVPTFVGPQRQTSQRASADMRAAQEAFLHALAAANEALLRVMPSNLEGPLFNGLYLQKGLAVRDEIRRLNGEFAHPHGEGSTHAVLSLVDAATAIESGWAERHRMSGMGSLIPWGFVLVYAPRDEAELGIWKEFVAASARYALGDVELEAS